MNQDEPCNERIEGLLDRLLAESGVPAQMGLDLSQLPPRGPVCPEDQVWPAVASGYPGKHDARVWIDHAACCQRCGAMLAYWAAVLCEEENPEEMQALAQLSSTTAAWRQAMATRLSGTVTETGSTQRGGVLRSGATWSAMLAAVGAVAAGAIFFLFLSNSRASSPEKLLAEAYSGHRIMEMRIQLAQFAPVDAARHTRGAGSAEHDVVPLLEARAAITQALMKVPEDPHWLMLQARADLLNEHYDTAIDTLRRLLSTDATNVNVLIDLASAYMMRAKATDVVTDEVAALDYLEKAAQLDAKNPVVLYNEAIVLQELYQYSNAVDVWHRFLAVERDRAWAEDGKRRLAEIEAREAKVKAQQSRLGPLLATPEGMLHLARSPALVAEYDEELSTNFLPPLLRAAFPLSSAVSPATIPETNPSACTEACRTVRELLKAVAASLNENHHDVWLSEILQAPVTNTFQAAVSSLADAVATSIFANPVDGLRAAQSAEQGFLASGSAAGVAAARVEALYNLEHLRRAKDCLATASTLPAMLKVHHYPLIEAKFWIDDAGCEGLQYDFNVTSARLKRALQVSSEAGYRIVHMRAASFAAESDEVIGNRDKTWSTNLELLKTYWDGGYPAVRLVMPNSSLANAELKSHPYAAVLLRREAWRACELSGPPPITNENHFLLVEAKIRAGETAQAARDLSAAEVERASLPGRDALQASRADVSIDLAEAYLRRGQLAASEGLLKTVASDMAGNSDRDMELRAAAAAGHLALLERRYPQADQELSQAVRLAELGYRETSGTQDRTDWIRNAREVYATLTLLRVREGRPPLEALAIWERYRILSSGVALDEWCHDTDLDCLAEPLEAARKMLRQETVAGSLQLDNSLLLWTMDDRGLSMHEVKIDAERFDLLCHTFSEMLATPASSEASVRFYGDGLAERLFLPIAGALDAHRVLVFDLDDNMEFLPVAALPVRDSYLGLEFATSTVRSVLIANQRSSVKNAPGRSVVIGASDPGDPDVPRLPEARSEANTVAAFLSRPRVFVGDEAFASSIKAAAPHASLIHFAGHTRFESGETRLLLARPGKSGSDWMDARSFGSHDFANCRLVVLSACSTGKREERDFGGMQDIVDAFTADGAQQVVATHWGVDSAASTSLMKEFYAGLARGLTVPHALLKAETGIRTMPEYRHPYYWAPYYVTGMSNVNLKELLRNGKADSEQIVKD